MSAARSDELSPLARSLAAATSVHRAQQVPLDVLWTAAVRFDRSLATAPHARTELANALTELEQAGVAAPPRDRSKFDRRSAPPLPLWIRRPAKPASVRPAAPVRIWPSQLQHAGRVATRADELELLETVNAFLRAGGGTRPLVPVRERSLELFGDEKRLDRLAGSRLFSCGALSLELLRCHLVPMPFAAQWVPGTATGEVVLVVAENHHTYASLLRVAREQAAVGGPARYVGYGAGQQFCSAVESVVLLEPRPTRIAYFGDLDVRGLQIPQAADVTARTAGLPPVAPALGLYRRLLEVGCPSNAGTVTESAVRAAAAWLGVLAAPVCTLLLEGKRLAQEAVGYDALTAEPQFLASKASKLGAFAGWRMGEQHYPAQQLSEDQREQTRRHKS